MKKILLTLFFVMIPFEAFSFTKLNGNTLVLLTSFEAKNLKENEQKKLIFERAKYVCHLINKKLLDYSIKTIDQENIYKKPKNPNPKKIYEEDILKFKIPSEFGLRPVTKTEIEVLYNAYHGVATIVSMGIVPPPHFYHSVVLHDIICVDEHGAEEYILE